MEWLTLGLLAAAVAAFWMFRALRQRAGETRRTRCPDCAGDLRGYENSPTCPHCFAILDEDEDEEDGEGPGSADEIDEDYDTPRRW
jgi:hypothetical protein